MKLLLTSLCLTLVVSFGMSSELLGQSGSDSKGSASKGLKKGRSTVTFPSEDGVTVTAELRIKQTDPTSPMMLLFHQARSSRGEYKESALKFAKLGCNCLAVDARSGGESNGVVNETAKAAAAAGKPTEYGDAYPDLVAALKYARQNMPQAPVLVVGSSYSASLVFKLAAEFPNDVKGLLAFSPAVGQWNEEWLIGSAERIKVPVFITSAQSEVERWKPISNAVIAQNSMYFEPDFPGRHGASALWSKSEGSGKYWKQVKAFLAPKSQGSATRGGYEEGSGPKGGSATKAGSGAKAGSATKAGSGAKAGSARKGNGLNSLTAPNGRKR